MSRRAQENIIAVLLLALFGGVIWLCQDFGPRARMIPLPLAIFGIILTVIQLIWQNLRSTDELRVQMIAVRTMEQVRAATTTGAGVHADERPSWRKEAGAYGIVAVLLGSIVVLGLLPAVFLFTGGYLLATRFCSWLAALIYTVIFTVTVYLLFFVALQIHPYYGLLATLFE
jgi:hypothetical protein